MSSTQVPHIIGRCDTRGGSSSRRIERVARVLVVEDDPDIAQLVAHYLEKAGFTAEITPSGRDALMSIAARPPDLLVLDLMLPQVDGLEICADDYLAKPFSPGELVARVRALLRRATRSAPAPAGVSSGTSQTVAYGPIVVDAVRHTVTADGSPVTLTAKEFVLLDYFLQHRGRVLSRDVLLTDVWGYRYTGGTRTVDVHIRRLREKLPVLATSLVTIKQFGYKLLENPDDH